MDKAAELANVTVIWVSPCFVYPHTSIPRDKSIPGGDTYNTRSERMQCSKYEQEESQNIV
jgi:hypothetical protein